MALSPLLVIETEGTVQLQIVVGLSETTITIGIPDNTVFPAGDDERHADFGVILEEVFIFSSHIHLLRLMLPQTIERLVTGTVERHLPLQPTTLILTYLRDVNTNLTVRNTVGPELLAIL